MSLDIFKEFKPSITRLVDTSSSSNFQDALINLKELIESPARRRKLKELRRKSKLTMSSTQWIK